MTVRVVFFGNSQNVFSHRFYEALTQTDAQIVGVVDVPPAKRVSTNPDAASSAFNYVGHARQNGVPVFEPVDPNTPQFIADMAALKPDLFLAVGYMGTSGNCFFEPTYGLRFGFLVRCGHDDSFCG